VKKKVAGLSFILVFLIASCLLVSKPAFSSAAATEDTWTAKAPMQQARAGLGIVAVNGKIYAIGGTTASGQYPPDVDVGGFVGTNEEYDPATDTWTTKASMPTPRDYFAIAACQSKIYCIGGAVGFKVDEWGLFHSYVTSGVNEVYDTVTDTWETKKSMPDDAMGFQAHVVNGKIYVMDWSHVYVYDPENDSWASKTRMPPPYSTSWPMSAVVGNKIIVTFVFSDSLNPEQQKIVIYDTETDSWSGGRSSPTIVVRGAAAATTGVKAPKKVYVLGVSRGFPQPVNNQVYDPEADAWTAAAPLPMHLMDFGVAVVNDVLYLIGGYYTESREAWLHGLVTPVAVNEQYTPIGYGTILPAIVVISPETKTYNASSVSLVFTVNNPANWTGYSLDGLDNVTITGNTTLSGLSNGLHNVTVYARDEFENTGVSETISFSVEVPFPLVPVAAASAASVAIICVGLLVYFKKRHHAKTNKHSETAQSST
jgi:N-acetylneuraminic acid mutarotase